ncbi:U3-containing 90S pre-ribosomal complex subunit-domain containing protein [Xylaria bambusicola]|uniref:U3-containing 90S pre-ribosomal complex subunit-domain containing protein n=1 Tax=Xylaria bambusicola TaxID=326684 RepID=UPI002007F51C|nr:U3-containing 90S pre-ribosomal complex subunit-domain containing protein [Xylaria bambusicola]KAI0509249.1 U3-containing 90S pre-ribosomal complex subunit-domain containing protein [Xylaria bambusicola]
MAAVQPAANPVSLASKAKSKKRAREDDGSSRKRKKSAYEQEDLDLDLEAGLNKKIGFLDSMLLADHLAQKTRRFGTDLKPVELSALDISPNAIKDSSSFSKPRNLESLPAYLEAHAKNPKKLGDAPKENGSPHTIIVTGAGLRAAELVRAVRKYQSKNITVGKLFAKHIKIEDTKKFLESHRTGVAVGTPVRLNDLVESGVLKLDKLEQLVVDASHIDQKKRGIMDMKETMIPLARWLCRTEFKERYTDSERPLQLLFY